MFTFFPSFGPDWMEPVGGPCFSLSRTAEIRGSRRITTPELIRFSFAAAGWQLSWRYYGCIADKVVVYILVDYLSISWLNSPA